MNAATFGALAEPNRLQIVELLRHRPLAVGQIAERLARVRELEPRATAVAFGEGVIDEPLVLGARRDRVTGIRVRGGETSMGGEISGRDADGFGQQRDRGRAVAAFREALRAIAQREQRRSDVLERDLGRCEPAERSRVAVLLGELPVRLLGLPELASGLELGRGVEGEAWRATVLHLGAAARDGCQLRSRDGESGDPQAEFVRSLAVHDPARGDPGSLG